MNKDLISVIMCVYNEHKRDLCIAIESILHQTYNNFEFLILIEYDSNPELIRIVSEYAKKDERIRVFYNGRKLGFPQTLNFGIKNANGNLIARMDADDISLKNRLKIQKEYMDSHPDVVLVSGNMLFINEANKIIKNNYSYNNINECVNKLMMYGNVVVHPCTMYRKKSIVSIGGYRNLDTAEDYDLWVRILLKNQKIHVINKVLLKYRIRNESASNRKFLKLYLTTKIIRECYRKGYSPSSIKIEEYIERYVTNKNQEKIIKAFSMYNLAWEKKKQNKYFLFLKYLSFSLCLNFDLLFVTRDSLAFNFLLNKAKSTNK